MQWIYLIAALASSLAAVLAWIAKILWAKENITAKNETIKAKDAQIEALKTEINGLKELNPMKIREYFLSVRTQLEEYNEDLKKQLKAAHDEIERKRELIEKFQIDGEKQKSLIEELERDKNKIQTKHNELQRKVGRLNNLSKSWGNVVLLYDLAFTGESIKNVQDFVSLFKRDDIEELLSMSKNQDQHESDSNDDNET